MVSDKKVIEKGANRSISSDFVVSMLTKEHQAVSVSDRAKEDGKRIVRELRLIREKTLLELTAE